MTNGSGTINGSTNILNGINSNNAQNNPLNTNTQNGPIGGSQTGLNSAYIGSNISSNGLNQSQKSGP